MSATSARFRITAVFICDQPRLRRHRNAHRDYPSRPSKPRAKGSPLGRPPFPTETNHGYTLSIHVDKRYKLIRKKEAGYRHHIQRDHPRSERQKQRNQRMVRAPVEHPFAALAQRDGKLIRTTGQA